MRHPAVCFFPLLYSYYTGLPRAKVSYECVFIWHQISTMVWINKRMQHEKKMSRFVRGWRAFCIAWCILSGSVGCGWRKQEGDSRQGSRVPDRLIIVGGTCVFATRTTNCCGWLKGASRFAFAVSYGLPARGVISWCSYAVRSLPLFIFGGIVPSACFCFVRVPVCDISFWGAFFCPISSFLLLFFFLSLLFYTSTY